MTSPLAKGLFHAAVDMSGSYVYNATLAQAESDNLVFLKKTGCADLSCLRRLSARQILQVPESSSVGTRRTQGVVGGNEALNICRKFFFSELVPLWLHEVERFFPQQMLNVDRCCDERHVSVLSWLK